MADVRHAELTGSDLHNPKQHALESDTLHTNAGSAYDILESAGDGTADWVSPQHAAANIDTQQTITTTGTATYQKITGWTSYHATGITFASDTWTITQPGDYRLAASLSMTQSAATSTEWHIDIKVNGTLTGREISRNGASTTVGNMGIVQFFAGLSATDTIDIFVSNSDATSVNFNVEKANFLLERVR